MNFERNIGAKKSIQIGMDAFAFKPDEITWQESKKPVHEWWIKTLLSKRRIYTYENRDIFLRAPCSLDGGINYGRQGFSLTYLRRYSEYKYVLWEGVYYEL